MEKIALDFDNAVQKLGVPVTAQQKQKLLDFLQLLHKWNKAYNLTSVRDPEQMLYVHILDSIAVAPLLSKNTYIDVGTGPGLPGIPLAIMYPDKQFVLLDSLGKRIRFIKQVAYELSLTNIEPVQSRVEDYQPETAFDGVLSRAFASISDMLSWCQHLTDDKGVFLALKGQYPEQELANLPDGFTMTSADELIVPGLDADRYLITVKRTQVEG
ncbi:16S rRNA (guanine(527)-N(7))-methyltransferase RsmG [Planctobacterium marinum]